VEGLNVTRFKSSFARGASFQAKTANCLSVNGSSALGIAILPSGIAIRKQKFAIPRGGIPIPGHGIAILEVGSGIPGHGIAIPRVGIEIPDAWIVIPEGGIGYAEILRSCPKTNRPTLLLKG
jgi:hypothetical protein